MEDKMRTGTETRATMAAATEMMTTAMKQLAMETSTEMALEMENCSGNRDNAMETTTETTAATETKTTETMTTIEMAMMTGEWRQWKRQQRWWWCDSISTIADSVTPNKIHVCCMVWLHRKMTPCRSKQHWQARVTIFSLDFATIRSKIDDYIMIFFPSLRSTSIRRSFCVALGPFALSENKWMNELKAIHNNVPAAKEPSKILFHESNDGISPKTSIPSIKVRKNNWFTWLFSQGATIYHRKGLKQSSFDIASLQSLNVRELSGSALLAIHFVHCSLLIHCPTHAKHDDLCNPRQSLFVMVPC